jgi:hypothetical protein
LKNPTPSQTIMFNAPANLAWLATQRGFMANDTLLSDVIWRDFKDGSAKLCFKDLRDPALLHMYVSVSPKNMHVTPNKNYHFSHNKSTPNDTLKNVTQHFLGEQPWGNNELMGKHFPTAVANLARIHALAGTPSQERRNLITHEASGDKVKFSVKLFTPVSFFLYILYSHTKYCLLMPITTFILA